MDANFNYAKAFSRNFGWVTATEQEKLRNTKIAIAGLGGVGGAHLLALARLGVEHFHIADFDRFEIHNFNRQVGAAMSTVGAPKIEIMVAMARDINPQIQIKTFPQGVSNDTINEFLDDIDIYVDGIDFFAMDARRLLFAACEKHRIPAITAAPLGMSVSLLFFRPGGMSFESYFKLEGYSRQEQFARFIAGLSPAMLQRHYLAVPEAVNFSEMRGPSTMMACNLCAGVMTTEVLKITLNRGTIRAAPWAMQFDAYHQKLRFTWRPFGNANPLQKLLLKFIRPKLKGTLN